MKTRGSRWFLLVVTVLATTSLSAQSTPPAPSMRGDGPAPASKPFNITRSDPGLDAVVAANTTAELIASGFGLNEGPVWVREGQSGYLLVSGLLDNVIYKIAADKAVSVFIENAGYTVFAPQPVERPVPQHPPVIAETKVDIPLASVSDAVMMLDLRNTNALMFKNASSRVLNMVYRRDDGTIGWVEPRGE